MNLGPGHSVWKIGDARVGVSPRGDIPVGRGAGGVGGVLRLADDAGAGVEARTRKPGLDARSAVAKENRLASGMSPLDARWVFARKATDALEGGTAAILRPEHRRRLLASAKKIGLRDFDANLIIAIVQDGRRSGRGALNPAVEQRLTLVHPAEEPKDTFVGRYLTFAIGLGIVVALVLIGLVA